MCACMCICIIIGVIHFKRLIETNNTKQQSLMSDEQFSMKAIFVPWLASSCQAYHSIPSAYES